MNRPKQGIQFTLSLKPGLTGLLILIFFFLGCAKFPAPEQADSLGFPDEDYLKATGSGKTPIDARRQAMAELSQIFESRVSSSFTSISRSAVTGNAAEIVENEAASAIRIESDVRVQGARIGNIWEDRDAGLFHALAVLDRKNAGRTWTSRLEAIDNEIHAQSLALETMTGRLSRMAALNRIMGGINQRERLETRLRVIDYPVEDLSGVSLGSLAGELAALKAGLRIYVYIFGEYTDRAGEIIARALSRKGIVLVQETGDANVQVQVRIEVFPLDLENPNASFARARGSVRIFEEMTPTIFAQLNENIRKGHKDMEEARRRAVESVSRVLSKGVLAALGYEN